MTPDVDVSVCIVSWNAAADLARCLRALPAAIAPLRGQVVVVDNGSRDDTRAVLGRHPDVETIVNSRNLGLTPGRNQAVRRARGRTIVMLDADTIPEPGSIAAMARYLDEHPWVGLVGPKLLNVDGSLQLSCRRMPSALTPFMGRPPLARMLERAHARHLMRDFDHDHARPVDWVMGACQCYRADLLPTLGAYDERIFSHGGEDTDWCLRTWKAGLQVHYVPEARVVHAYGHFTRRRPLSKQAVRAVTDFYYLLLKHRDARGGFAREQARPGGRPLLYYSTWPLGYHNRTNERKARAFARFGYDVVFVTSVGTKDPGLGNLAKAGDRLRRKVGRAQAQDPDLRTAGILVAPPRRRRLMRRLNAAWVERQLRRAIAPWPEAVAWVRWPTPELVVALGRLRPRVVVYECVDAYHAQPGMRGAWQAVHDGAERALVALADVVVTPSEPLAERFRAWGADVRVIPHGVDLPAFGANGRAAEEPVTVGFVGTLDYKLDIPVLRAIADAHPEWRLRLIGPVQEGFDPGALAHLPNVTIEPPVPPERVSELNATFDVGLMPYFDHPAYYASCPLKNLEYMAVGKPAVARPAPALEPFADTLYFARRPAEFVAQLERALAEDTPERARARRAVAEANTWDRRLEDFRRLLDELTRR